MRLPEQEQRFAPFKAGNGHVLQLESNSLAVIYCVAYQLVKLLGQCTHWLCEMIDLHIPSCVKLSSMYLISPAERNRACLSHRLLLMAVVSLFRVTLFCNTWTPCTHVYMMP
jgi:hypothetical protein